MTSATLQAAGGDYSHMLAARYAELVWGAPLVNKTRCFEPVSALLILKEADGLLRLC